MDQFTSTIGSTQFINYIPPSSQDNIISRTQQANTSNKFKTIDYESDYSEPIPSSKFWSDSETRALISYLADNFDLYRKNKSKFYGMAANKIGNNRTSAQVNSKIQSLRENVKPDYLTSSIDMDDEYDNYDKVSSHKKRKISEVDQMYFDELRS
ncbi:12827_t:CDS:2, partial [Dentiscutata heterogama]